MDDTKKFLRNLKRRHKKNTTVDLDRLERLALAATPGPWNACGSKCKCEAIMCADYPVAAVTKGDWGDDYPSIRIEGGSLDAKAVPFMAQITYGNVSDKLAMANREFIAAVNPVVVLQMIKLLRQKT